VPVGQPLGQATGLLDGDNLHVYRVDVASPQRGNGYSLALMQALLQRAIQHDAKLEGVVNLIADEGESAGLRAYYGKMGFVMDQEYGATDKPTQHPMKASIGPVISNLQIWRAARYQQKPVLFTHL